MAALSATKTLSSKESSQQKFGRKCMSFFVLPYQFQISCLSQCLSPCLSLMICSSDAEMAVNYANECGGS